MNRRDFLKLSGLSTVGALAAKLGLPVPQALAQGGIVVPAPHLPRSGVMTISGTSIDPDGEPVSSTEEAELALSHNYIYEFNVNPGGPIGSPVFMGRDGRLTTVETRHFIGRIVGEGFDKDRVSIATAGLAVTGLDKRIAL